MNEPTESPEEPVGPALGQLALVLAILAGTGAIATDGGGVLRLCIPVTGAAVAALVIARLRRGRLSAEDARAAGGIALLAIPLSLAFGFAWSLYAMSPRGSWLVRALARWL